MPKASKKKILFYNWIQFDEPNNLGGGVNVYQKNLIEELIKENKYEIYFLSSGVRYDILRKKTYIEKTKNCFGDKCKSFRIVNSACTAPMSSMYENIDTFLTDDTTYETLKNFIKEQNGFDIIHFNNIEGLSSKSLEIKKDFPKTKTIYSLHNYLCFTPQVNMFYLCENADSKEIVKKPNQKNTIRFYKLDSKLRKLKCSNLSTKILSKAKKIANGNVKTTQQTICIDNKDIARYCDQNVGRINEYIDIVLAVSERTREIGIKHGIDENKIHTEYIGTAFAEKAKYKLHEKEPNPYFTIAYMGYFEKVKGFNFLINALKKLPNDVAKRVDFVCYARIKSDSDKELASEVIKLNKHLHSAKHFNGYSHEELGEIMKDADLGIVPVIWEYNLPQVAIEYAAHGVPVLASNLGGAHELSKCKEFVFKANDEKDFLNKLNNIILDRNLANKYFENMIHLNTLRDYIDKLEGYYDK